MVNDTLRKKILSQLVILTLILPFLVTYGIQAQTYTVRETLNVGYDGTVHVMVEILIAEPAVFTVNVTLHEAPEGLLVYDENNMPLNYEILKNKITVFIVNNSKAYVEYLTRSLTRKEGPIWTITFTFNDGPINILFPKGTYILDITGTPKSIKETEEGKLLITFEPGEISVDYALPMLTTTPPAITPTPTVSPTPTASPTPTKPSPAILPIPYEYLLGAVVLGLLIIVIVSILKFRR